MRETLYLINVGVPHLGEEAEGWWGVRVVHGELDVSLGEQSGFQSTHISSGLTPFVLRLSLRVRRPEGG